MRNRAHTKAYIMRKHAHITYICDARTCVCVARVLVRGREVACATADTVGAAVRSAVRRHRAEVAVRRWLQA